MTAIALLVGQGLSGASRENAQVSGSLPWNKAPARFRRVARHRALVEGVEAISGVSAELTSSIQSALQYPLVQSDLGLGIPEVGKVRDIYDLNDKLVIVTTDRQSAFDRLLAHVPFKGQVLNLTSAWWMQEACQDIPNSLLAVPHPNVAIMAKCRVFPVEFVVRGFITGSTDTSLWTHYKAGARQYCGNTFPDGLHKNQRLADSVLTPTTKAEDHDEPISPVDIVARGLMTQQQWDEASALALRLFARGQAEAQQRGLLLVDTKYELGLDAEGQMRLVDEIHTPDSSRYWVAATYEERHSKGQEPQNIDKEFLRLWFRSHCNPYKDKELPPAPPELVVELSRRYIHLYQTITGQQFQPASTDSSAMASAVHQALERL